MLIIAAVIERIDSGTYTISRQQYLHISCNTYKKTEYCIIQQLELKKGLERLLLLAIEVKEYSLALGCLEKVYDVASRRYSILDCKAYTCMFNGWIQFLQGHYAETMREFNDYMEINSRPTNTANSILLNYCLGCIKGKQGNYQDAYSHLTYVINTKDPEDAYVLTKTHAYYTMVESLMERQRYREAFELTHPSALFHLKCCAESDPRLVRVLLLVSCAQRTQNKPEEADNTLRMALKYMQNNVRVPDETQWQVLFEMGNLYYREGRYQVAKAWYDTALNACVKISRNHWGIHKLLTNIGNVHRALGRHSASKNLYLQAGEAATKAYPASHPASVKALVNLGTLEVQLGSLENGVQHIQKGREILAARNLNFTQLYQSVVEILNTVRDSAAPPALVRTSDTQVRFLTDIDQALLEVVAIIRSKYSKEIVDRCFSTLKHYIQSAMNTKDSPHAVDLRDNFRTDVLPLDEAVFALHLLGFTLQDDQRLLIDHLDLPALCFSGTILCIALIPLYILSRCVLQTLGEVGSISVPSHGIC